MIIKVNLREKDYECIYSHNHDVYEQVKTAESYDDFIKKYAEKYICEADWVNVQKCLAGENLTEHLVDVWKKKFSIAESSKITVHRMYG